MQTFNRELVVFLVHDKLDINLSHRLMQCQYADVSTRNRANLLLDQTSLLVDDKNV